MKEAVVVWLSILWQFADERVWFDCKQAVVNQHVAICQSMGSADECTPPV